MKAVNVIKITKLSFLASIILGSVHCPSQSGWYYYDWKTQQKTNHEELFDYAYNYDLQKYKNNIYTGGQYKKFAMEEMLALYTDYNSGSVYKSLNAYEEYVRKVLAIVVKDTAVTNKIRISFYRSDEFTASMNGSGFLQINVGLMAGLNSEAELALVLSHEVAHFLNQDALKNYGKRLETRFPVNSSFGWVPGVGIPLSIMTNAFSNYGNKSNYYWFTREQETQADKYSIGIIRESPYSLRSAANVLRALKRMEIRSEIRYGKTNKAFVSHPDPGERLNLAKRMLVDTSEKIKKDFVVDSLAFVKLKEICFQETINIGLINNNLENITVLTFTRYLLYPQDKENLAVLIESLRRILAFGKTNGIYNRSFILSSYQTPAVASSGNYAFLNKANPSILNHLKSGFIDIWKEDFHRIKASDLADTTVTEFTSYIEAYMYFKEKARLQGNALAEHYKYFGENVSYDNVKDYIKNNNLFQTNDYLGHETLKAGKKSLVVLIPPSAGNLGTLTREMDLKRYKQETEQLLVEMKDKIKDSIVVYDDLPYEQQHLMDGLLRGADYFVKTLPGTIEKRSDVNWLELFPETYGFFKMNDINNLVIYHLSIKGNEDLITDCYKISLPQKVSQTWIGKKETRPFVNGKGTYTDFKTLSKEMYDFYKLPEK